MRTLFLAFLILLVGCTAAQTSTVSRPRQTRIYMTANAVSIGDNANICVISVDNVEYIVGYKTHMRAYTDGGMCIIKHEKGQ